jgi:hypothetical protein
MLTEEQGRVKSLLDIWEGKQGKIVQELRVLEGQQRRNSLVIFGVEENLNERYIDILKIVEYVFRTKMRTDIESWHIDTVTRLVKRKGSHLILVRFTFYLKKYEILLSTRTLVRLGIRIEQSYSVEMREIWKELIPYMKDARDRVYRALLRGERLMVNCRLYELGYLREKIPIEAGRQTLDSPVYVNAQEMHKQNGTPQDLTVPTSKYQANSLVEARL